MAPLVHAAVSQVFIPSVAVEYTSTHHADILCALGPMMDEVQWKAKGLDNYGLIAVNPDGNAAQVTRETMKCRHSHNRGHLLRMMNRFLR